MTTIIIDRAVVEQALEAAGCERLREWADIGPVQRAAVETFADTLSSALAQPDVCTWQQDGDSDSGVYGTSCGRYFNLDDGTPEDNKMHWCCYCGKTLAQELITEDGNE